MTENPRDRETATDTGQGGAPQCALRRVLLTTDGAGKDAKRRALNELLALERAMARRAVVDAYKDGWQDHRDGKNPAFLRAWLASKTRASLPTGTEASPEPSTPKCEVQKHDAEA